MEPGGALSDGEWASFLGNFCSEELHFSQREDRDRFNVPTPLPQASMNFSLNNENLLLPLNVSNSKMEYDALEGSQRSDFSTRILASTSNQEASYLSSSNFFPVVNDVSMPIASSVGSRRVNEKGMGVFFPAFPGISMEETVFTVSECLSNNRSEKLNTALLVSDPAPAPTAKEFQVKRKVDVPGLLLEEQVNTFTSKNATKKPRVFKDVQIGNKNMLLKGKEKIHTDGKRIGSDEQSTSSYGSEDENASTSDPKAFPALNLNGITRANKGSATDPQSVYARKRRERINQRLRTLQNLIPNGTKVDISTMLEEAVNYVKFLQLQIKLLSSDDLWMYAPLAFNGVDIGLNTKLSSFL